MNNNKKTQKNDYIINQKNENIITYILNSSFYNQFKNIISKEIFLENKQL